MARMTDDPAAAEHPQSASFLRRISWPVTGFGEDYLKSDAIGNYSRRYSWSANQLGHVTLGLVTALLVFGFLKIFSDFRVFELLSHWDEFWPHRLTLLLGAPFLATLYIASIRNAFFDPRRIREPIVLCAFTVLALALMVTVYQFFGALAATPAFEITDADANRVIAQFALLAMAFIIIFSMAAQKSFALIALATITFVVLPLVAMSFYIETSVTTASVETLVAAGIVYVFYSLLALTLLARLYVMKTIGRRVGYANLFFTVLVVGALSATFVGGGVEIILAVMLSLLIWFSKEYGNDLALAVREVDAAEAARAAAARARGVAADPDDYAEARDDFVRESLADTRTDGAFYVIGALIGAALVGAMSVLRKQKELVEEALTHDAAAFRPEMSASELRAFVGAEVGAAMPMVPDFELDDAFALVTAVLVVFYVYYALAGFSWTRRGQALDLSLVPQAGRLAVTETPLELEIWAGGAPAARAAPNGDGPASALMAFAQRRLAAWPPADGPATEGARPMLRQLIVAGGLSDAQSLGAALASEAVISHRPVAGAPRPLFDKGPHERPREVRYVSAIDVFAAASAWRDPSAGGGDAVGTPAPVDMLVLDHARPILSSPSRLSTALAALGEARALAEPSRPLQLVWLIDDTVGTDFLEAAFDEPERPASLDEIRATLAERLHADWGVPLDAPIGVVRVHPADPPPGAV